MITSTAHSVVPYLAILLLSTCHAQQQAVQEYQNTGRCEIATEFECDSRCIPRWRVCDGITDCRDGSDEHPDRCSARTSGCQNRKADIMFLVDGSDSIGSYFFKNQALPFVGDVVSLFRVGPQTTQFGFIQYSDIIREEFDFRKFTTTQQTESWVRDNVIHLRGMTQTGAALKYMLNTGFTQNKGARTYDPEVARIAIVITDGRAQDSVSGPSAQVRAAGIQLFAIGVTEHVRQSELLEIVGGVRNHFFLVSNYSGLNPRLRNLLAELICPLPCTSDVQCARNKNEVCLPAGYCGCPVGFQRDPVNLECGSPRCDPQAPICPPPEICKVTPYGDEYRCTCPPNYHKRPDTGVCVINTGGVVTPVPPTSNPLHYCILEDPSTCDQRLNEWCIRLPNGTQYCGCPPNNLRNPSTRVCEPKETCARGNGGCQHTCQDTTHGVICYCNNGYDLGQDRKSCVEILDKCRINNGQCEHICQDAGDGVRCSCRPGFELHTDRKSCVEVRERCSQGNGGCSHICVDVSVGVLCSCPAGFQLRAGGKLCAEQRQSCALNNGQCQHICEDTNSGVRCSCRPGYYLFTDQTSCLEDKQRCAVSNGGCQQRCKNVELGVICSCESGFELQTDGKTCFDTRKRCAVNNGDCHQTCQNVDLGVVCSCQTGFTLQVDGRTCSDTRDRCNLNNGNCYHQCQDVQLGVVCSCQSGWILQSDGKNCVDERDRCNQNNGGCQQRCRDVDLGVICSCESGWQLQFDGRSCVDTRQRCNQNNGGCDQKCREVALGVVCNCNDGYALQEDGRSCIETKESCSKNNGFCEHICTSIPTGVRCSCRQGYELYGNGKSCILTTPTCTTNNGGCQQICLNSQSGIICQCRPGFQLNSDGITCAEIPTTPSPGILCSEGVYCKLEWGEVCLNGRCVCPDNFARRAVGQPCVPVIGFELPLVVIRRKTDQLYFGPDYANANSGRYVEVADLFETGIRNTLSSSNQYRDRFVDVEVKEIINPRTQNASLTGGLWFKYYVYMTPESVGIENDIYKEILNIIIRDYQYSVGGTELYINPWQPGLGPKPTCGNRICRSDLNEACLAGRVCGCAYGYERRGPGDECIAVECHPMFLRVVREGARTLQWQPSMINPDDSEYRRVSELFQQGIGNVYDQTAVKPYYVSNQVIAIQRPRNINGTWVNGMFFNFTVCIAENSLSSWDQLWTSLYGQIKKDRNQISGTNLFIDGFQYNPFGYCISNAINKICHKNAWVFETEERCVCQCPTGWRDPGEGTSVGAYCINNNGYNDCINSRDNDCHTNAHCIDEFNLYSCKCKDGFNDCGKQADARGRCCQQNRCDAVKNKNFCSINETCVEINDQPSCICRAGYIDVTETDRGREIYQPINIKCLLGIDIDECFLGLHNCSAIAQCINIDYGYTCKCPQFSEEGNPALPGRLCAAKRSCGMCNGHGDCVPDPETNEIICQCNRWYSGTYCDKDIRYILLIILAIIFLLLALCCLLFFCLRCRCVETRRDVYAAGGMIPWAAGAGSHSELISKTSGARSASDLYRADYGQYLDQDSQLRIPRPQVDTGVASRMRRSRESLSSSGSEDSSRSSASWASRTEVDKRILTSQSTKVTTKSSGDATAEFHVYPPVNRESVMNEENRSIGEHEEVMGRQTVYGQRRVEDDNVSIGSHGSSVGQEIYDQKTTVRRGHGFDPHSDGQGGTQRFKNEVTTTTTSNSINNH